MPPQLPDNVWEQRRNGLLDYLREHPNATRRGVRKYNPAYELAILRFFNNRFDEAKFAIKSLNTNQTTCVGELDEYEQREKRALLAFMRTYPSAGYFDIQAYPELFATYRNLYRLRGGMEQLRIDAGVANEQQMLAEERRQRFLRFLKSNPTATRSDVKRVGYDALLQSDYENSLTNAKLAAGLPIYYIRMHGRVRTREDLIEKKRQAFLKWVKKVPDATAQQARIFHPYAFRTIYRYRLNDAKQEVGVPVRDIGKWRREYARRHKLQMASIFGRR